MKSFRDITMSLVGGGSIAAKEEPTGQAVAARLGRRQWLFLVAILVAIGLTEWVFAYKDVAYGIGLALFVVIGIYVVISVTRLNQLIANCAESLALIPLYILFTSSLPWFFINQQYLLPAVYATILGLCLWHIYQKKLAPTKKDAPYYWRVKAIDGASNESKWSDPVPFYVRSRFALSGWARNALIGLGVAGGVFLGFWLGRRTARSR